MEWRVVCTRKIEWQSGGGLTMENNITAFIEALKILKSDDNITAYDLYESVKDNDKLLRRLCDAIMTSYDHIEHIKKILG